MELVHEGVTYEFEYDFAPNDGTDRVATSTVIDGETLDGRIFITGIWVGDKPRPVATELLGLMWAAAAREELAEVRQLRQRLAREAELRRARTCSELPRD